MDISYLVRGGTPLKGDVTISGSKNAALPLLAATLLVQGDTVLDNVPRLSDTEMMVRILAFLGADVSFEGNTVRINTDKVKNQPIPAEYVSKLRGSIVLLGPLLARFGVVEMSYPGGCVLGKRPVGPHIEAFEQMGAEDMSTDEVLHLQGTLHAAHVVLPEFSVTATENVLMAASLLPGETRIDLAAGEPHVQDLQKFLQKAGVTVDGVGNHTVRVTGKPLLKAVKHRVVSDYLEAGAFVLAGLVTHSNIRIHEFPTDDLLTFLYTLQKAGCVCTLDSKEGTLSVDGELSSLQAMNVRTNIFPGFPTDLQAPIGVAMTQAHGVSRMFERLFEGRLAYLYELEKMGAHVEILNSHQALIIGPTPLKGRIVASNDIRAGCAMVLAALCAEGETTITDVRYIERGYDKLDEKLRALGANIVRTEK
ncbi:MAG: UDP-N-acetylglucosamine 1-carboxyvinyltransferase [Candidatus Peribacteria bacterium]|nr:UDP-N-acetylglucosamine 1-carboxyvinyltransferase [Candidatus Peribacteria bacterium]